MAPTEEQEISPFELLNVDIEASEQEIRSSYRKRSLKVHPDRNPNNPLASQKFHELNQAYEVLLDPLRRLALTSAIRVKAARKARFAKYDEKRKHLQEELEERERAFKKQKLDKTRETREREEENARIKELGRKMREERENEILRRREERGAAAAVAEVDAKGPEVGDEEVEDVPSLGHLDTTVKLKYTLTSQPTLTDASSIASILSQFGEIDEPSIVISLKPAKKAPTKSAKHGTALVPFKQIGGAFAAVCASGRRERRLEGVEISWADGKEPPILAWLKKNGKLDGKNDVAEVPGTRSESLRRTSPAPKLQQQEHTQRLGSDIFGNISPEQESSATSFPSFPSSFSSAPEFRDSQQDRLTSVTVPGLDYESLTLMRLRKAERERLEREIREQEANE